MAFQFSTTVRNAAIDAIENRVRDAVPAARVIYIEPDVARIDKTVAMNLDRRFAHPGNPGWDHARQPGDG